MPNYYSVPRLPLQEQAWQNNHHKTRNVSSSHHTESWDCPEDHEAPRSQRGQSYHDRDSDLQRGENGNEESAADGSEVPWQQTRPLIPYEVMTKSKPAKRIDSAPRLVASDVDCAIWDESHIRRWRALAKDVPQMKSEEEKEKAINLLIDCFHRLNLVNDQEHLIDIIYDYCEPDVNVEVRKLGCQFLVRLSNNSTPKHIKRNIDVLCQLLSIIADNSDHLPWIAGSLRQHFIFSPRITIQALFSMNICAARKEDDKWEGPCLTFYQDCLKELMAGYVESEIELCQQLIEVLKELVKLQKLQPSDVDFALRLVACLRFDFSKRPSSSSEDDLEKETSDHLRTLTVFVVDYLMGLSAGETGKKFMNSSSDGSSTQLCAAKTTDYHSLLRQILTLLQVNTKHAIVGISSIDLLSVAPSSSSHSSEEKTAEPSPPWLCYLPDRILIKVLRHFCNAATKTSPATTHDTETRQIKQNLIAAIVKLLPTVEVSKEAQHASTGLQMEVAEALLIACTILWPLQRKSRFKDLEIDAVRTRLQSLYAMSQALKSKASEEKEEEKTKRSIEEAQEWEEQINAAHNVHRIAMEYLRQAEKRDAIHVTAGWLEKKKAPSEAATPSEASMKRKSTEGSGKDEVKKAKEERPLPECTAAERDKNLRKAFSISEPRGRGVKMAPIQGASVYSDLLSPAYNQQQIEDRYRHHRHSSSYGLGSSFHEPRGGYRGRYGPSAPLSQAQSWDQGHYGYGYRRR